MDTSLEAEFLMLGFLAGRGYVAKYELSEEARLWMAHFVEERYVSASVKLVPGLPFLASGQTCYALTILGHRRLKALQKERAAIGEQKHPVSGVLLRKAGELFERVTADVISAALLRGLGM